MKVIGIEPHDPLLPRYGPLLLSVLVVRNLIKFEEKKTRLHLGVTVDARVKPG